MAHPEQAADGRDPARARFHVDDGRLAAPGHLLGRDSQVGSLRNALARAARGGQACMMVSGPAGSGKTALLGEVGPLAAAHQGWVVFTAADPARRDAPSVMFEGLRSLGRQLLAEPAERVQAHRHRILEAVGADLGVALTQLPEFQLLLGEHPPLVIDDPAEAESRGIAAAVALLRSVSSRERPLVLVYDDVQWAPRGSGRILDAVLTAAPPLQGLLVVCAYNPADLDEAHALHGLMHRWATLRTPPERLQLDGLNKTAAAEFVAAVLRLPKDEATRLATVLGERTLNNPGDTLAVLDALRRDGLLQQTPGSWRWDAKALRRHVGGASPAELKRRLHALPADTLALLRTLACLGTETSGDVLGWAADVPVHAFAARAVAALDDGVLLGNGVEPPQLRLASDAVGAALLAGLPRDAVQALHLAVARRLAARLDARHDLEACVAAQYLAAQPARHAGELEARDVARLFQHAAERVLADDGALAGRYLSAAMAALAPFATATDAGQMQHLAREHGRTVPQPLRLLPPALRDRGHPADPGCQEQHPRPKALTTD